jgi:hypothetical protein
MLTLAVSSLDSGPAQAQPAAADRLAEKQLAAIKRQLSYKGDKATTWYVIQLQTVTTTSIGRSAQVRSSIQLAQVQGQDEAAQMVLDFLKGPSLGTKTYLVDRFHGTEVGKKQMETHVQKLMLSGLLKGYRPSPR